MPAMVTPLGDDYKADLAAAARLIGFYIESGSHGVVVLGSSGEFQGVRYSDRAGLLSAAVEAAAGRIPVIAGAGLPNLWATIDQVKQAADCGADAALVTPPYYFPIDQDAIVDWFTRLVGAVDLPVLYYHFPTMTKLVANPDTVGRLADCGVCGLKDSGGSPAWLHAVLGRVGERRDFRLFLGGDGHLLDALIHGADGCIGLAQNLVPHISAQLYEAYCEGDLGTAVELQRRAVEFGARLRTGTLGQPFAKAVLSHMGLCSPVVAPPMKALSPAAASAAFGRVEKYLLIPTSA